MRRTGTLFFLIGLTASLAFGWVAFPRLLYERVEQPVAFSHKIHAGEKVGLGCDNCHGISEDGRFAGVAGVAKCAECHAAPVTDKAAEKYLVEKYVTPNREIPWLVYSRQPQNVSFSHATHIRLGELKCEQCHGRHGANDTLRPFERNRVSGYSRDVWGASISRGRAPRDGRPPGMKMDDCSRCHRERNVADSCMACHR